MVARILHALDVACGGCRSDGRVCFPHPATLFVVVITMTVPSKVQKGGPFPKMVIDNHTSMQTALAQQIRVPDELPNSISK